MPATHDFDELGTGGIKFVHLNVASVLGAHKMDMLRQQIDRSSISVFCVSETWLTPSIPDDLVKIEGYNLARWDRSWADLHGASNPKKGGGLLCYVQKGIEYDDFKYAHLNKSCKDLEMQWVTLAIKNMRKIVAINIYRPPQGDHKKACKLIHEAIADANLKDNAEIFLLGDFNVDLKNKKSPLTKELETTLAIWSLKPQIKGITRPNKRGDAQDQGSCIDNIFTNSEHIVLSKILNWNFSDHLAVAVKRKRERVKREKVTFRGRSYKNYLRDDLQQKLVDTNWGPYYELVDPGACWDFIEDLIRDYLNNACPLKMFKVWEVREPWVTNEILEEIKDKDRSLRTARRTGKAEDWDQARRDRNRVGRLVEQARADFLKEQQDELADDPKKFWHTVKSIIPVKKATTSKISLVCKGTNGGNKVVDPDKTADFINDFFSNIGPNIARDLRDPWVFYGEEVKEKCPQFEADLDGVLKLCRAIKVTKSSGITDISSRVLKDSFLVIIPQLVHMFNTSFLTGVFPDKWKIATIIPLYKGGDKSDVSNYRPVSLLPLPGKLIEKIVHAKVSLFLERSKILSDQQGGFRKGFSTASSIVDLTNILFDNINKGLTSLVAFIDLKKAFDTVNHEILVKKLALYGFQGTNLQWCVNYLAKRTQRAMVNNVISEECPVVCGVPQGSVLGPLFFILYVNDVQKAVNGAHIQLYADDTVLVTQGSDCSEAVKQLQPALNQYAKWCHVNKLSLNANKTKLMPVGTRFKVKKARLAEVTMKGVKLQLVPTYKYLGFILDTTLSFNSYVNSVIKLVAYKANLLSKIRRYLTESTALKIYKSMIVPYFDYGDVIYNTANSEGLDKLQRLQNRCLKICKEFNMRFDTDNLHAITGMPKLADRRICHINNFMYGRLTNDQLVDKRNINTRAHDAPLFKVKVPKIETYKRSVEYAGAVRWNLLPTEIRNIDNSISFKLKQKKIMYDSVNR